ncbi:peptide synthase, partial [Myxococcota bacterium]|nr:peptide synthase [Myxococcota bacterium]
DVVVDKAELASALLKRAADNPKTARIKRLLYHPAFPVDVRHNAKIHRGELAEWAARQTAMVKA